MVVDLFSGLGGWSMGLRALGETDLGLEVWPDAARTAHRAGHRVVLADVAQYPPEAFAGAVGLIASPPCQTFSVAGDRAGVAELVALRGHLRACRRGWAGPYRGGDPRTGLVLEPMRWVCTIRPRWVALEQVPAVEPIWQTYALVLGEHGYAVWSGVLDAADYGVPQRRRRAVLLASLDGTPSRPPRTQAQPVTMAAAIGTSGRWLVGRVGFPRADPSTDDGYRARDWFGIDGPAPTLTGKARSWRVELDAERPRHLTVPEALTLQGLPGDYPVAGTRTAQFLQVGNAVPPPMAAALLREVRGCRARTARPRAQLPAIRRAEQGAMF